MVLDSHVHFWKYHPVKNEWITDDMKVIQKDFLPDDVGSIFKTHKIDGCIAVQASQSEDETNFLLELASENTLIKGVVGWIDLSSAQVEERLDYFSSFSLLKGFRHIVQAEPPGFLSRKEFMHGIKSLHKYDFTYDILISENQLQEAAALINQFTQQHFVIDHIAKPNIKHGLFENWKKNMMVFAQKENVFCKISGMVTEADLKNWKNDDFIKYIDTALEIFGTKRIMFGSDWPVCLLAASYYQQLSIVKNYFSSFSKNEQEMFFGGNAATFYRIKN